MAKKTKAAAGKLRIQYYRSAIGFTEEQKLIVKGLGLRKLRGVRKPKSPPEMRGVVEMVPHLWGILWGGPVTAGLGGHRPPLQIIRGDYVRYKHTPAGSGLDAQN